MLFTIIKKSIGKEGKTKSNLLIYSSHPIYYVICAALCSHDKNVILLYTNSCLYSGFLHFRQSGKSRIHEWMKKCSFYELHAQQSNEYLSRNAIRL